MERNYEVNRRIDTYIKAHDKKPTAIADKAGISRDIFSRILRCKRPLDADEIVPVCKVLGITVDYLFSDVANIFQNAK